MNAIEIRDLSKSFRGLYAVDGLNMTVPIGAIYGFIGENLASDRLGQWLKCRGNDGSYDHVQYQLNLLFRGHSRLYFCGGRFPQRICEKSFYRSSPKSRIHHFKIAHRLCRQRRNAARLFYRGYDRWRDRGAFL